MGLILHENQASEAENTVKTAPIKPDPAPRPLPAPLDKVLSGVKWQVIAQFAMDFATLLDRWTDPSAKTEIELRISEACAAHAGKLSPSDQTRLVEEIKHELLGFGPIQPLLED